MKRASVKTNISDAISKGESLLTQGRLDEAETTLQSALQNLGSETTASSALSKGNILSSLSVVQKRRGRHDKVLRSLKLLLRHIVENSLGRFEEAITLVNIGTTLFFLGKIDLSLVYTMKACRGLQRLTNSAVGFEDREQPSEASKRRIVSNQVLSSFNMAVIQQALDNSVESMRWLNAAKSMAITNFGFRQKITELVTRTTELKDKQAKPFFLHLKFEDGSYTVTNHTDDKFMSDDQGRADEARSAITAESGNTRENAQIASLMAKKKVGSARPPGIALPPLSRKIYSSRENTLAGEGTVENGSLDRFPKLKGPNYGLNLLLESPKRSISADPEKVEVVGVQVLRLSQSAHRTSKPVEDDRASNNRSKSVISEPNPQKRDKNSQTSREVVEQTFQSMPTDGYKQTPPLPNKINYREAPFLPDVIIGQTSVSNGSYVLGSSMESSGGVKTPNYEPSGPAVPSIQIPSSAVYQQPQIHFSKPEPSQDQEGIPNYPWLVGPAAQQQGFRSTEGSGAPAVPQAQLLLPNGLNYHQTSEWVNKSGSIYSEQTFGVQMPPQRMVGFVDNGSMAPLTRVGHPLQQLPMGVRFSAEEQQSPYMNMNSPYANPQMQSEPYQMRSKTFLPWPPTSSNELMNSLAGGGSGPNSWGPPQPPHIPHVPLGYNPEQLQQSQVPQYPGKLPFGNPGPTDQRSQGLITRPVRPAQPVPASQVPRPAALPPKPLAIPTSMSSASGTKRTIGAVITPMAPANPAQRGLAIINSQAQTSAGGSGQSTLPASKRSSLDKIFEKKYGIARFEEGTQPGRPMRPPSKGDRLPHTIAKLPDWSGGERKKQLDIDRLNITLRYMG